jgi:hypothetical protein
MTHIDDLIPIDGPINAHHKKKMIKFRRRVEELDRKYEKNNNGELDDEVYNKYTESVFQSVQDIISVILEFILH